MRSKSKHMPRILITDGLWRKSVVAIRALGKENIKISVTGENYFTSGFFSKYCSKKIILPNPKEFPDIYRTKILEELKKNKYDLIIPMEDDTIKVLLPIRKEIEETTSFPFPNNKSMEIAFDKIKTLKLAKEIGIPIPNTYFDLNFDINKIQFPIVIKPAKGSGSRGLIYVENKKDFIKYKKNNNIDDCVVQERLPSNGEEVGVNLLFDKKHRPITSFTYKRLRDYPISGGPSTLRESTLDPNLKDLGIKLLKALNWVGIAMVEFKKDIRDGKYKLMEINPRFWGSLALPVAAGVNFPFLLYQMSTKQTVKSIKYKIGIKARWLIPGDILHFLSNPKRFSMSPSFFDFFDKNTVYDDFDSTDFKGNIGIIICTAVNAFRPKMWQYVFRKNR